MIKSKTQTLSARQKAHLLGYQAAENTLVAYLAKRGTFVSEKELAKEFPALDQTYSVFEVASEMANGSGRLDVLVTGGVWYFAVPGTPRPTTGIRTVALDAGAADLTEFAFREAQRRGMLPDGYTIERFILDAIAERNYVLVQSSLGVDVLGRSGPIDEGTEIAQPGYPNRLFFTVVS